MALDEAILESAAQKWVPPTLRLYAWSPACISIGNAQPLAQIDRDRLQKSGWEIVRRPTGGRAILHTDELTYSVAAALDETAFQGGVLASYRFISAGLINALERIGLQVVVEPEIALTARQRSQPICFEVPSSYEITVQGKKLVGSAQLRRGGGFLQHGSLPLYGDIGRISRVLVFDDERDREQSKQRLRKRATTVERLLGHSLSWNQVAEAMQTGFSEALDIQFVLEDPTSHEQERAAELIAERYDEEIWLERA
jgi:lipoyl(octanoyl) transferase